MRQDTETKRQARALRRRPTPVQSRILAILNESCTSLRRRNNYSNMWSSADGVRLCATPTMAAMWRRGWIGAAELTHQTAGPDSGGVWHLTDAGAAALTEARR